MRDDLKERALQLAIDLGIEIYTSPPEGGPRCTSWRYGMRGSADQYGKLFDSAEDAAVHFLTTQEAQMASRTYYANAVIVMGQCVEAMSEKSD